MSFGFEQSQQAGGGSLTGAFVSKIKQSREDAKAEKKKQEKIESEGGEVKEKDKKNLFRKALAHNMGGGFFGGKKSFSDNFTYKQPPKNTGDNATPKGGGTAPGLTRILTQGFGALATDTTQIQGSLAEITQALRGQLAASDFTANNLTGVQSILSDQLENQVAIIESLGGVAPTGSGGSQQESAFGNSKSKAAGADTLTGFISKKIQEAIQNSLFGLGGGVTGGILTRFPQLLTNPMTWALLLATIGSIARIKEIERMQPFVDETTQKIDAEDAGKDTPWYKKLGNYFAKQQMQQQLSPMYLPVPGAGLSGGGISKYAAGTTSMIGEAGKEQVVDLNSADARNSLGSGDQGNTSMQAVGGSLLSVVDQFLSAMGPLGAPVSQAIGPEISNLAREFGVSQSLGNLSISGSKFKDNGQTKKQRDAYMKELVSKSLISLGAKKDDRPKKRGPGTVGTPGPGTTGTPEQRKKEEEHRNAIMETVSPGGVEKKYRKNVNGEEEEYTVTKDDVTMQKIGTRIDPSTNKPTDVKGPGIDFRPVEGTGGSRFYDINGELYAMENNKLRTLTKSEKEAGWNGKPFIRKPDTAHVRVNEEDWTLTGTYQRPPAEGEYSYKFGKIWAKGTTGNMKDKFGWLTPPNGGYGGRAPALPSTSNIQYESGGSKVTVVPKAESGMIGPSWLPWNWGKLVENQRKSNTGLGYEAKYEKYTDPEVRRMMGLPPLKGYEDGGVRIVDGHRIKVDPRGYPDHDGYFNPFGFDSGIPNPFVSDSKRRALAKQRQIARENSPAYRGTQILTGERLITGGTPQDLQNARGYEKGGSAFGMKFSNQLSIDDRVNRLEDTMKYLLRTQPQQTDSQPKSSPRTAPSASPVTVPDQSSDGMVSPTVINLVGGGGSGSQSSIPISNESSFSTADYMSDPWPNGMAGVLCSSPWGVYN